MLSADAVGTASASFLTDGCFSFLDLFSTHHARAGINPRAISTKPPTLKGASRKGTLI